MGPTSETVKRQQPPGPKEKLSWGSTLTKMKAEGFRLKQEQLMKVAQEKETIAKADQAEMATQQEQEETQSKQQPEQVEAKVEKGTPNHANFNTANADSDDADGDDADGDDADG